MKKILLLISFCLACITIGLGSDRNQVSSYTDGNILLKVYTSSQGQVTKRVYLKKGIKYRQIIYKANDIKIDTKYDQSGNKIQSDKYEGDLLVKTSFY